MNLHSLHQELVLHRPSHCSSCRCVFAKQELSCLLDPPVELPPQVHQVLKSKGEAQELLRIGIRQRGLVSCFNEPVCLLKGIHHSNNAACCFGGCGFRCTYEVQQLSGRDAKCE